MTVRSFMAEYEAETSPVEPSSFMLHPRVWPNGVVTELLREDFGVRLSFIESPPRNRGKGRASKVLLRICELADAHAVTVTLCACAMKGGSLDDAALIAWYERFGFEVDWVDEDVDETEMKRLPDEDAARPRENPRKNPVSPVRIEVEIKAGPKAEEVFHAYASDDPLRGAAYEAAVMRVAHDRPDRKSQPTIVGWFRREPHPELRGVGMSLLDAAVKHYAKQGLQLGIDSERWPDSERIFRQLHELGLVEYYLDGSLASPDDYLPTLVDLVRDELIDDGYTSEDDDLDALASSKAKHLAHTKDACNYLRDYYVFKSGVTDVLGPWERRWSEQNATRKNPRYYHGGAQRYAVLREGTGIDGRGIYLTSNLRRAQMYSRRGADGIDREGGITEVWVDTDQVKVWDDEARVDLRDFVDPDKPWLRDLIAQHGVGACKMNGQSARVYLGWSIPSDEDNHELKRRGYQAIRRADDLIVLDPAVIQYDK